VSIANSGFQESGGMILQIPYFDASGAIFFIYSNGSLNSSSVGLYVGASCNPCGRVFLLVSRLAVGWPLLSTLVMSNGWARRALSGSAAAAGLFALPLTNSFPRDGVLLLVPLAGESRMAELEDVAVMDVGT